MRTLTHEQEASLRLAKRATIAATAAVAQRNLEIISAHVHGCTIKQVADATGLSTARIHQIIHGR